MKNKAHFWFTFYSVYSEYIMFKTTNFKKMHFTGTS